MGKSRALSPALSTGPVTAPQSSMPRESAVSDITQLSGNVGALFEETSREQVGLLIAWEVKSQSVLGFTGARIEPKGLWLARPWHGQLYALLWRNNKTFIVKNVKFVNKDIPIEATPWPRVYRGDWALVGSGFEPVKREEVLATLSTTPR